MALGASALLSRIKCRQWQLALRSSLFAAAQQLQPTAFYIQLRISLPTIATGSTFMPDEFVTESRNIQTVVDSSNASASLWLRCQQEAEAIIAPDGKLIQDFALRNQRISAAYASLWLRNNRFQWPGLAAFASKQVGCGMLNALHIMERTDEEISRNGSDGFDWVFKNSLPAVVHLGAGYMRGRLSLGNMSVFLDIYPLHRFYELCGLEQLKAHIGERQSIKDKVKWPVRDEVLPFGKVFPEIVEGFTAIEQNDLLGSVRLLAYHEQVNVLQRVMYDDALTRAAIDANQLAWASELPGGDFNEIQLTLAAQCAAKPSPYTAWFSRHLNVHLYDPVQRMEFVYRSADEFDQLLRGSERADIEHSLHAISEGRGVE
jgi:hypothetical protein